MFFPAALARFVAVVYLGIGLVVDAGPLQFSPHDFHALRSRVWPFCSAWLCKCLPLSHTGALTRSTDHFRPAMRRRHQTRQFPGLAHHIPAKSYLQHFAAGEFDPAFRDSILQLD